MFAPDDLANLLAELPRARVAVVGDLCLDAYWILDDGPQELSVETGLPTQSVREQRYSLGGAGNVVANLRALGIGHVRAFGVVGDDPFGSEALRLLGDAAARVHVQPGWSTHAYAKPYLGDSESSRLDFGCDNELADASGVLAGLDDFDLVVVNEQIPLGMHGCPSFRQALASRIAAHPALTWLLDSRNRVRDYPGCALKLNAEQASGMTGTVDAEAAAISLFQETGLPVFVTMAEAGLCVCDGAVERIPSIPAPGATDTVGAGDSMVAGIAAALAVGRNAIDAGRLGTLAAGVTVRKLRQTGIATAAEVRQIVEILCSIVKVLVKKMLVLLSELGCPRLWVGEHPRRPSGWLLLGLLSLRSSPGL